MLQDEQGVARTRKTRSRDDRAMESVGLLVWAHESSPSPGIIRISFDFD